MVMKVDPNDPRPPYAQIADDMREAIRSGELAPGQRLPSGRDLATQYGVALMTIQKALATLRSEGLLHSYRGRGTFVHGGKAVAAADDLTALKSSITDLTRRVEALEAEIHNR
jgi:GntR family transcriptional regulator